MTVWLHADGGSLKSQMKKADRSGARYALILGEQELADGTVQVRDLSTGEQQHMDRAAVAGHVADGG